VFRCTGEIRAGHLSTSQHGFTTQKDSASGAFCLVPFVFSVFISFSLCLCYILISFLFLLSFLPSDFPFLRLTSISIFLLPFSFVIFIYLLILSYLLSVFLIFFCSCTLLFLVFLPTFFLFLFLFSPFLFYFIAFPFSCNFSMKNAFCFYSCLCFHFTFFFSFQRPLLSSSLFILSRLFSVSFSSPVPL
jgi:hypothetical protein